MSRLILDHFRRWRWLLAACAAFAFAQGWFFAAHENLPFEFWILMVSMWSGANLLQLDQKQGASRVMATLPLTARQLGQGWWLATVAIPAIVLTAMASLGAAVCGWLDPDKAFPVSRLAVTGLFILAWLGSFFTAIQGVPSQANTRVIEHAVNSLLGLLSTLMLFGSMLICQNATKSAAKCALILVLGGFLTLAGWLRRESFARMRPAVRMLSSPSAGGRGGHRAAEGAGGLPYFFKSNFIRIFLSITAINVLMAVTSFLMTPQPAAPQRLSIATAAKMSGFMTCGFIVYFHLMTTVRSLRFLRTMPVSATWLAAAILAQCILPIVIQACLAAGIIWALWGAAMASVFVKSYVLLLTPTAICVFLSVQGGNGVRAYTLIILTLLVFVILDGYWVFLLKNPVLPMSLTAPAAAVGILLSFVLTRRTLLRSSSPFRVQAGAFGNPT